MIIDHIGIVVKSLIDGIDHWEQLFGYRKMTEIVENSRQKVKVVFLKKNGSTTIKLIEPVDKSSPVYFFSKRGGGLHHICFKCSNIEDKITYLKGQGSRVLTVPQPGEAFENEMIAFLFTKQGLNIELIDTDKKAMTILYNEDKEID